MLRGVVRAEWRTFETEASAIEVSQLSIDELPARERAPADLADLLLDRAVDGFPRSSEGTMRKAVETPLPSTDVESGGPEFHDQWEVGAALSTCLH